jgi:hypothetical protein
LNVALKEIRISVTQRQTVPVLRVVDTRDTQRFLGKHRVFHQALRPELAYTARDSAMNAPHREVRAMTYARKTLVSLNDTAYYHVVARCVRRVWLWGFDKYAGRDFSHRKQWVLERLQLLTAMFAIDVCAYAILSNHYHLVLHVDRARAQAWSRQEVVAQWQRLFVAPPLVERWLSVSGNSAASFRCADARGQCAPGTATGVMRCRSKRSDDGWVRRPGERWWGVSPVVG